MALPRIIQQVRALFSAFTGSNPDAATPEVGVLPIEKGGTGQTQWPHILLQYDVANELHPGDFPCVIIGGCHNGPRQLNLMSIEQLLRTVCSIYSTYDPGAGSAAASYTPAGGTLDYPSPDGRTLVIYE